MTPADSFAPYLAQVFAALIAGALLGTAWESWRERRHRKAEAERIALDTLRWLFDRSTL